MDVMALVDALGAEEFWKKFGRDVMKEVRGRAEVIEPKSDPEGGRRLVEYQRELAMSQIRQADLSASRKGKGT